MKVHTMKSGDTFTYPSLFVNLQHSLDAKAMHIASNRGLSNIDGIVVDQLHYSDIANDLGFNQESLVPPSQSDMRLKLRLIDPALHYLLVGNDDQKVLMLASKLFDARIHSPIKKMMHTDIPTKEKTRLIIDQIYPY